MMFFFLSIYSFHLEIRIRKGSAYSKIAFKYQTTKIELIQSLLYKILRRCQIFNLRKML